MSISWLHVSQKYTQPCSRLFFSFSPMKQHSSYIFHQIQKPSDSTTLLWIWRSVVLCNIYIYIYIFKHSWACFLFPTPPSHTVSNHSHPSGPRYTVCFWELWRLQWKLLMRALTAVLLQIQEAHLATQHGEPIRAGRGSRVQVSISKWKKFSLYIRSSCTRKLVICQWRPLRPWAESALYA